jgi:hypothetical protein
MKIKLILIYILFNYKIFSQEAPQIEKESPFKLQHFCTGIILGYESGFKTYSSKLFIGHSTTLCSMKEKYALVIDDFFALNTTVGKWNFNNTLTYRINYGLGIAYSSNIYIQDKKLNYAYGFGVTGEMGSYISIGGYYYPQVYSIINHSNFGVRLAIRPVNLLMMWSNLGSHWTPKKQKKTVG